MLEKMFIQNFALIDKLEIQLNSGFNVMTGETGAGKSIIIDAVDVAIGGQGLTEYIRSGEDKALVEAFFNVAGNTKMLDILEESGFLPDPGESLIMSRELVKTGKNICRVNGRHVSLSLFKEIAKNLVDIYGQHHQQSLLDPQKHIELLDDYGGRALVVLKENLGQEFARLNYLESRLKSMESNEKEQARMSDIYKFQIEEIETCQLKPGEDLVLEEEKNILANTGKLAMLADSIYEILYEGGRQKAVTDLLHEAVSSCKEAGTIDETLKPVGETLESALYQITEAAREMKAYAQKIEANPTRFEDVDNRLNLIRQLKKKYGDSIEEILAYRDKISDSLGVLDNYDEELQGIKEELALTRKLYNEIAGQLSEARRVIAAELRIEITKELKELNMPHVSFQVRLAPKKFPTAEGLDEIEFMISPNQGEPLKPLAKIVSGGEVSRIMLAFKTILAKIDSVFTLIFDEVDTGIGGEALRSVAHKLFLIGRDRQVICVTHSPQIAGCADSHYRATKLVENNRTVTRVVPLTDVERVEEIARMLAGGQFTPVTKKHAEEILKLHVELNQQKIF